MINEQLIPRINVNDDTVEVSHWYVDDKTKVKKGQDIVDLGTSKATVTIQAEHEGYLKKLYAKGALAKVGQPVAQFFSSLEDFDKSPPLGTSASPQPPTFASISIPQGQENFARFSPRAKEMMEKKGIDPKKFDGLGLVTASIIEKILDPKPERPAQAELAPATAPPAPRKSELRVNTALLAKSEKVSLAKSAEIDSLTAGQEGNVNSSLTVQFEAERVFSALKGHTLFSRSLFPIIIFELSKLLEQHPRFNAFFHDGQIHYYNKVNVGVAIDSGKGLCVVTLPDTNKLFPVDIFDKLSQLTLLYLQNKLKVEDLSDSTFTVSDLSSYGILQFQPLINRNQAAILGIGGDKDAPHFPMTLTLTFDHRVLTGLQVSEFLNLLKKRVMSYAPA